MRTTRTPPDARRRGMVALAVVATALIAVAWFLGRRLWRTG
jgi:hypothetical protein